MVILFHFKTTSLKWAISAIQQSHSLSLVGSFSHLLRLLYYISSLLQHLPPSHSKLITLLLVSEKQNLSKENFLILSTWVCFFLFVCFVFVFLLYLHLYLYTLPPHLLLWILSPSPKANLLLIHGISFLLLLYHQKFSSLLNISH